jgi:antitoxin YefM
MTVVSLAKARCDLGSLIDDVIASGEARVITRRGGADAVVMPRATYSSLKETAYLLSSPANAARLAVAIADYRQGRVVAGALTGD